MPVDLLGFSIVATLSVPLILQILLRHHSPASFPASVVFWWSHSPVARALRLFLYHFRVFSHSLGSPPRLERLLSIPALISYSALFRFFFHFHLCHELFLVRFIVFASERCHFDLTTTSFSCSSVDYSIHFSARSSSSTHVYTIIRASIAFTFYVYINRVRTCCHLPERPRRKFSCRQ